MDIAPPWHKLSEKDCSRETRRCAGGDSACREQAARDGYVAISTYTFCPRDEVHTVLRTSGWVLATLVMVAIIVVFVVWKRRAQRKTG